MSNTDIQDNYQPYVDAPDESAEGFPGGDDDAAGTTLPSMSLPDEAPRMELATQIASALREELDRERKWIQAQSDRNVANDSGYVKFSRYSVPLLQPIQICREMRHKGRVIVSSYTAAGDVSIGLHTGIRAGGTDTISLPGSEVTAVGVARREIRTRVALWAVALTAACEIDVMEEFD